MKKVLFVCRHNSARSQMAEELLRKFGGDKFIVKSAGLEAGKLNPYVVQLLQENEGIDISNKETKSVFDLYNEDSKGYHAVITVCDEEAHEKCPIFPGILHRIHWSFKDPSKFTGSDEEILIQTKMVMEQIKESVLDFIKTNK